MTNTIAKCAHSTQESGPIRRESTPLLSRLRNRRSAFQHASIYRSAVSLSAFYEVLDRSDIDPAIADLAERETANSLSVASTLLEGESDPYFAEQSLSETRVVGLLADLSPN